VHCYGSSVVAALLWRLCCGGSAVAALLWRLCYGGSAMAALLWQLYICSSAMVDIQLSSAMVAMLWQLCTYWQYHSYSSYVGWLCFGGIVMSAELWQLC